MLSREAIDSLSEEDVLSPVEGEWIAQNFVESGDSMKSRATSNPSMRAQLQGPLVRLDGMRPPPLVVEIALTLLHQWKPMNRNLHAKDGAISYFTLLPQMIKMLPLCSSECTVRKACFISLHKFFPVCLISPEVNPNYN